LLVPLGQGATGVLITGGFVPVQGGAPAATSVALLYRVDGEAATVAGRSVQISQPRVARYEHTAVLLAGPDGVAGTDDDRVLVFGGIGLDPTAAAANDAVALGPLASAEVYEPALDRWSSVRSKNPLPPAARPRHGHRCAHLSNGGALVLGGQDSAKEGVLDALAIELDRHDPSLASFTPAATLAHARRDAELAEIEDGRIVLAGGVDPATGRILTDAEVFSPDGRTREPTASLGGARTQHSLAALGAQLLVLGGIGDPDTYGHPTAELVLLFHR
jgi:hypothetical protein